MLKTNDMVYFRPVHLSLHLMAGRILQISISVNSQMEESPDQAVQASDISIYRNRFRRYKVQKETRHRP